MTKETAASYKLDFKYTFKEGRFKDKHFTLSDFSRHNRYYDHKSSFDYSVVDILQKEGLSFEGRTIIDICAIVDSTPEMAEAQTAFDKWLKRREPVVYAWTDYVEYLNGPSVNYYDKHNITIPPIGSPVSLMSLANCVKRVKFRQMLETSRPYKMPIGSPVILADKYKNSWRYDPYYWGEHRDKPRVGTIVKYADDVSGGGGIGSRYVEVMFFADGTRKNIPERGLLLYNPSATKEQ
jgi:hypothetical protein